jgi:hypothetical protein
MVTGGIQCPTFAVLQVGSARVDEVGQGGLIDPRVAAELDDLDSRSAIRLRMKPGHVLGEQYAWSPVNSCSDAWSVMLP